MDATLDGRSAARISSVPFVLCELSIATTGYSARKKSPTERCSVVRLPLHATRWRHCISQVTRTCRSYLNAGVRVRKLALARFSESGLHPVAGCQASDGGDLDELGPTLDTLDPWISLWVPLQVHRKSSST